MLHWPCYRRTLTGVERLIVTQLAPPLLFGIAANTDNLTVGVAYGMNRRWIRWPQNLLIAAFTSLVTLCAMALGWQIRKMLPSGTPDTLGGILLLMFAAWNFDRDRRAASSQPSLRINGFASRMSVGTGEILFLASTLSINNMGLAVAGGIGGVSYVSAASAIFFFSVAMLALGQAVGSNLTRMRWAPRLLCAPISGDAVLALAGVLMMTGY